MSSENPPQNEISSQHPKRIADPIRIAIVGVGNCAKSLLEGIAFYTQNPNDINGLMHPTIGGYEVRDIEVVAAFDVDERKVGKSVHKAILSEPNCTQKIHAPLPSNVIVQRGPTHDSIILPLRDYFIHESDVQPVDVTEVLKASAAQVVVNYLPSGSSEAARAYAESALAAECHFVNCMTASLAKDGALRGRFEDLGLVLLGDDIKSQCGATIVNRMLLQLFAMRGVTLIHSNQINYGGNADHFNLHHRPETKEATKEDALRSSTPVCGATLHAHMKYTEENYDHKRAEIAVHGEIFGRVPVSIKLTLEDEDSPNSGGVVVDAIRAAMVLKKKSQQNQAAKVAAFLMKSPPVQMGEAEGLKEFQRLLQMKEK